MNDTTKSYWVKWQNVGQTMTVASANQCSILNDNLTSATSLTLPQISEWVDPSSTIGSLPTGITLPKVIDGVNQQ